MDLSTRYLGFDLPHPFMPGASPLVDDLDMVWRLEDSGAAAIVMHSLFEEQLRQEELATHAFLEDPSDSFAEALSYLPTPDDFKLGPEEYLEQIYRIKEAVTVPVIASLNGTSEGGWVEFARLMEEAGADALELNLYHLATDPTETAELVESRMLERVQAIKEVVKVPVAVKLSPFLTSMSNFCRRLQKVGADGVVVFNRFYDADIDPEELEVKRVLHLSTSSELVLRLRWLAILKAQIETSLAVTGGVHTHLDAIKAILCGADAVQLVAALLREGPEYLILLRRNVMEWMDERGYESLEEMRGAMSLARCPDPQAYERANYIQVLQSWRGADTGSV